MSYGDMGSSFSPSTSQSSSQYGKCCEDRVALAIYQAVQVMQTAVNAVTINLEERVQEPCKNIEQCVDKIIAEIDKKYRGPLKSCEQCKQMVRDGLSGTVAYALQCASVTCDKCDTVCRSTDPTTDGKCCDTCGKEKCICHDGACIEDKQKDDKGEKYVGWCNYQTGVVLATKEKEPGPGGLFQRVALADSELAAIAEAESACKQQPKTFPPQQPSQIRVQPASGVNCNISTYGSGGQLSGILSAGKAITQEAAFAQQVDAISKIGVFGVSVGSVGEIIAGMFSSAMGFPIRLGNAVIPALSQVLGCGGTDWSNGVQFLASLGMIEKITGVNVNEFAMPTRYAMNAICRQRHLPPENALAAYLANALTPAELDTHFAIAGLCKPAMDAAVIAAETKPVPLQLSMMRRRKLISESEYRNGMRAIGYLKQPETERLHQLTESLPTLSDIIRFMVRDADDNKLATNLGLDAFFTEKYGRQLKEWSDWQGIPENVAKYAWRSHWSIPSPGQLFTFWHRLRNNPAFGGPAKLDKDIRDALVQQDILPYWHNHFLAVSFLPIGRVDIRRAYNIGALTDAELVPAYLQLGYSDADAATLAKFTRRLRDQAALSHRAVKLWLKFSITRQTAEQRMTQDGLPADVIKQALDDTELTFQNSVYAKAFVRGEIDRQSLVSALTQHGVSDKGANQIADLLSLRTVNGPVIKAYVAGTIERDAAKTEMISEGMDARIATKLLEHADEAIDNVFALQCQRGIKRRWLLGEISTDDARAELIRRGTVLTRTNKLIDWWGCERASQGKTVPAAKLCHLLSVGTITPVDFLDRLVRIGYSQPDAELMLADCLTSVNAARLKEAKAMAKEQSAAAARAASIANRNVKEYERQQKAAAAASKAAQSARQNREKQRLKAAQKVALGCDCELFNAVEYVRGTKDRLQSDYGLNQDESMQVIIVAAETWGSGTLQELDSVVNEMAEAAASVELETASANGSPLN